MQTKPNKNTLIQAEAVTEVHDANDLVLIEEGQVILNMDNAWNYAYTAWVYLGTPPQKIKALFDTGSANTWIMTDEALENRTSE